MVYESLLGDQSPDEKRNRLQAMGRIGGMWLRAVGTANPRRGALLAMMAIVDSIESRQELSAESLRSLGGVFCENCRHIHPQVATLCQRTGSPAGDPLASCYLMGLAN